MNLQFVTFTGVDEQTNLGDLAALSREYPFVEWGLMFSATRTGFEPRYPSLAQLEKIGSLKINKAVHLNDTFARNAAEGTGYPLETALQCVPGAKRIQINLFREIDNYPQLFHQMQSKASALGVQIILQVYGFDTPMAANARGSASGGGVVFLHDGSGGQGIAGDFQRPVNNDFVGFAGGIRKENVEAKLEQIAALDFPNPFWIDMESGVRTDGIFDLDKVETILRIVKSYVNRNEQR